MQIDSHLRSILPVAGAAALLLTLGGCVVAYDSDSTPHTYTTGQWIQKQANSTSAERGLATRVAAALDNDPLLADTDIDARVTGGVVTLTGHVFSLAAYEHAIEVVQKVSGVKHIAARIELDTGQDE